MEFLTPIALAVSIAAVLLLLRRLRVEQREHRRTMGALVSLTLVSGKVAEALPDLSVSTPGRDIADLVVPFGFAIGRARMIAGMPYPETDEPECSE